VGKGSHMRLPDVNTVRLEPPRGSRTQTATTRTVTTLVYEDPLQAVHGRRQRLGMVRSPVRAPRKASSSSSRSITVCSRRAGRCSHAGVDLGGRCARSRRWHRPECRMDLFGGEQGGVLLVRAFSGSVRMRTKSAFGQRSSSPGMGSGPAPRNRSLGWPPGKRRRDEEPRGRS